MAVVIVTGSNGSSAGGGDIALTAIDWANIVVTSESGVETSQTKTIAGINSTVVMRAEWTSTSSNPARAKWVKNGSGAQSAQSSPVEVSVNVNDQARLQFNCVTPISGNYDTGTVTVTNRSQRGICTMTIASPCVISKVGHQLAASMRVRFSTTGALPTGLTAGSLYYVLAAGLTANDFTISATDGGAAINSSGSQSGAHTVDVVVDTFTFECQYVYSGYGDGDGDEPFP